MVIDYKLIKTAGLTKADVSRLFGVSRQTVHNWFGGNNIHALIEPKVGKLTAAIKKAVDAGVLPIELAKSPDVRKKTIANIVRSYL